MLAFIRIGTNPSILPNATAIDEATSQVETWLAAAAAVVAEPTARHAGLLRGLLRGSGTAGNLTTDAHLAALAIEHGADVVSYDCDFARFPGVRHPGVPQVVGERNGRDPAWGLGIVDFVRLVRRVPTG
jgi:toxin-antitoxin system PIN domain toxin